MRLRVCLLVGVAVAAATSVATSADVSRAVTACLPSQAHTWRFGMSEVRGTAGSRTLWGLFYGRRLKHSRAVLRAPAPMQPTKIIWRIGGPISATPSLLATGPSGQTLQPQSPLAPHMGSSWARPGTEWGSLWVFPSAGCWTFTASSDGVALGQLTVLYRP